MNSLQLLVSKLNLDENRVLNALQGEAFLVSDLCLTLGDVAAADCFAACSWVLENKSRLLDDCK